MRDKIVEKLAARFGAYQELIAQADDTLLQQKLEIAKHKSLAEHLWCVVGARESYTKALAAGAWQGFACSLTSFTQADFETGLRESAERALATIAAIDTWSDEHNELLATLAEHEVMHEGQIIRHVYGLGRELPASWTWG